MSTHPASDLSEHDEHGGLGKYVVIFFILCFLTGMSFLTYSRYWPSFLDNEATKRTFMMAVSCTKAMLVIMFFMHLLWEANWKYVLTVPASLMSIFLLLMLIPDVGMRLKHVSRERQMHMAVEKSEHAAADGHSNSPDTKHQVEHPGQDGQ